jgi:hypothetical protein
MKPLKEAAKYALDRFEPGEFMLHSPADDGKVIEIGPIIGVRRPAEAGKPSPRPTMTTANGSAVVYTHGR